MTNGPMRAYTSFGTPVVLHRLRAVVETAGLALHDEEPERISRLFEETIADFSIGRGRPRVCGKCRQRSLKLPSKPSGRRRPLLGDFVFRSCVSGTRQIQRHRRALRNIACRLPLIFRARQRALDHRHRPGLQERRCPRGLERARTRDGSTTRSSSAPGSGKVGMIGARPALARIQPRCTAQILLPDGSRR
jgi:hypothetical protein